MAPTLRSLRPLLLAVAAAAGFVAVVIAVADSRKAWAALQQADWRFVPVALAWTAVSYLCLSAGFANVARSFGIRLQRRDLLEIGFVTFAINNLMSVSGVTGASLRVWLLRRRGFPAADILGASLVHSYLNHLAMLLLLPAGLLILLASHPLSPPANDIVHLVLAGALAVLGVMTALLLRASWRARLAVWLEGRVHRVSG